MNFPYLKNSECLNRVLEAFQCYRRERTEEKPWNNEKTQVSTDLPIFLPLNRFQFFSRLSIPNPTEH